MCSTVVAASDCPKTFLSSSIPLNRVNTKLELLRHQAKPKEESIMKFVTTMLRTDLRVDDNQLSGFIITMDIKPMNYLKELNLFMWKISSRHPLQSSPSLP